MRKITIGKKEYPIDCNALTFINYRKKFNRGIFEDIEIIENFLTVQIQTSFQVQ